MATTALFPERALIGMVHAQALPGSPRAAMAVAAIAKRAAEEARVLIEAGFDALIVENMHDAPYVHAGAGGTGGMGGGHPPETVAGMTRCVLAVCEELDRLKSKAALGVQVLSGGNREALAITLASGLGGAKGQRRGFIRCENFVFAHVADEGVLERAEAGPLLRYRRSIGAEGIAVLCDIKKKHASHAITADVTLADAAHGAEFFGADGLIVTGVATGRATEPGDVKEVRAATGLPVLVGSGVEPSTVGELFEAGADALIVGSYIKRGGDWRGAVDAKRCRAVVSARR